MDLGVSAGGLLQPSATADNIRIVNHGFTTGQPVTYQGADGRQYVAILSGVGGWSGAIANAELDPRVRNGALGFVGATQDLPAYTRGGSTLLVFALPEQREGRAENLPGSGGTREAGNAGG